MNARLPLRAIPSDTNSLPPYETDTRRFRCTVEGVTLDTLIYYDDDFGIEVSAIWHRGVNIAPCLSRASMRQSSRLTTSTSKPSAKTPWSSSAPASLNEPPGRPYVVAQFADKVTLRWLSRNLHLRSQQFRHLKR